MSAVAEPSLKFRHEYSSLVASLTRRLGSQHFEAIEDAVQNALVKALEHWPKDGEPDNTTAWLYTVAYRQLLNEFSQSKSQQKLALAEASIQQANTVHSSDIPLPNELQDAQLRMLFACIQDTVPQESQLVFTLKCLCGFSIEEVAHRLFISTDNAYKRYDRAKQHLRSQPDILSAVSQTEQIQRLGGVLRILYLLFTEGHLSSHQQNAIREELCQEAIRLNQMLLSSSHLNRPETNALLALMFLHLSRLNARQCDLGHLLLLEEQDRTMWDRQCISLGLMYLERSAEGEQVSRYHLEASIAAQHCLARSFAQTPWDKIADQYAKLEQLSPSVVHRLNRAVAVSYSQSPKDGLDVLTSLAVPKWLERSYIWYAVLADLQWRSNQHQTALSTAMEGIHNAPNEAIKQQLHKRFSSLGMALKEKMKHE